VLFSDWVNLSKLSQNAERSSQILTRQEQVHVSDESLGSRFGASYLRLLRVPGAATLALWGMAGRLPIAMRSISVLVLVSAVTGSLAEAGAVSAVMLVTQAMTGPAVGRLADRYGQRRVLLTACPANALAIGLLLVTIVVRTPLWLVFVAAVATGGTSVSFGSFLLARWSTLVSGKLQQTAFALESMLEEAVFLLGPLLVALLVSAVAPAAGLVACGVLATVGFITIALHGRSEPPIGTIAVGAAEPADAKPGRRQPRRVIALPGVQVLMVSYAGMGFLLGAVDVTMVAFAREQGAPGLGGVLLALTAAGSLSGGAFYGARDWKLPKARLLAVTTCLLTLGVVPLAFAPSFAVMDLLAVVAGLAIAPALIAGTTLLQAIAPEGSLSEAFSWLTSTGSVGIALGTAAAGRVAGLGGFGPAAWLAVAGGAVAMGLTIGCQPSLRRRPVTAEVSGITG
jgi:MFS family permease